jgi:hypothetical protein
MMADLTLRRGALHPDPRTGRHTGRGGRVGAQRNGRNAGQSWPSARGRFLRVFYAAKGAAFYLQNPAFWAKIAVFALTATLSILPTVKFIVWQRPCAQGARLQAGGNRHT